MDPRSACSCAGGIPPCQPLLQPQECLLGPHGLSQHHGMVGTGGDPKDHPTAHGAPSRAPPSLGTAPRGSEAPGKPRDTLDPFNPTGLEQSQQQLLKERPQRGPRSSPQHSLSHRKSSLISSPTTAPALTCQSRIRGHGGSRCWNPDPGTLWDTRLASQPGTGPGGDQCCGERQLEATQDIPASPGTSGSVAEPLHEGV